MKYNIGQLRPDKTFNYLTSITENIAYKDWIHKNPYFDTDFKDAKIEGLFSRGTNYYTNIKISAQEKASQTIYIKLKNDLGKEDAQVIKEIIVPALKEDEVKKEYSFELIFSPNEDYKNLVLELKRDPTIDFDYVQIDDVSGQTIYGRTMICEVAEFYVINNIIPGGISSLTQLGVQGRSGLLMCIDGEEIRVGRSGIYEINCGYKINFLGLVLKKTDIEKNFFLIDYKYENK